MAAKDEFGLTAKQRMCADYYLSDPDMNEARAYLKAYPNCKKESAAYTAFSRLKSENVKFCEYINQRKKERSEKTGIDAEYVLKGIESVIEDAKLEKDRTSQLKGYELLGKHLKLFTDKLEISVPKVIRKDLTGAD